MILNTKFVHGSQKNFCKGEKEKRLLHRMSGGMLYAQENPNEAPEEGDEKKEGQDTEGNIDKQKADISNRTKGLVGPQINQQPRLDLRPPRPGVTDHLRNAANTLPSGGTVLKAAVGTGIVLNPVVGLPAAALAYGTSKVYGVARHFPGIKQVDQGVRAVGNATLDAGGAALNVATAPIRAGYHVTKAMWEGLHQMWDVTGGELLRDITTAINHKFDLPEGTNMIAAMLVGIKKALVEGAMFPFRVLSMLPQMATNLATELAKRPIRTSIGIGLGLGAVANPVGFSTQAVGLIDKIIGGLFAIAEKAISLGAAAL